MYMHKSLTRLGAIIFLSEVVKISQTVKTAYDNVYT